MKTKTSETNDSAAAGTPRIEILKTGPYALYGAPELRLQFIETDETGTARTFRPGRSFATRPEPVHLCRCGASKNKPYCDGSHTRAAWDPTLTAPHERRPEQAVRYDGPGVTLLDDEPYCALARFCDAGEGIWQAVAHTDDPSVREEVIREAGLCPGGRLTAIDKAENCEPDERSPELGLIEDPQMRVSGGIRIRGPIPVIGPDGIAYEVRDRAVLCRCGQSHNKPCCNGTHLRIRWQDGLAEPVAEPAEV